MYPARSADPLHFALACGRGDALGRRHRSTALHRAQRLRVEDGRDASDDAFAPVQSVGVTYPAPASEDGEHAEGLLPSPSFHAVPADTIALSGELLLTQVLGSALAPVA